MNEILIYKAWHDQAFCEESKHLTYEDVSKRFAHELDINLFFDIIHLQEKTTVGLFKKTKSSNMLVRLIEILNNFEKNTERHQADPQLLALDKWIQKYIL